MSHVIATETSRLKNVAVRWFDFMRNLAAKQRCYMEDQKAPNIVLSVKHNTAKQGKVFSEQAYAAMRQQLSNLIRRPYVIRLKDVWCSNAEHHAKQSTIIIDADTKEYEITEVCCNDYERLLNNALVGVERDPV